ncbi:PIN-like domain-containing protein [Vibrio sp. 945]|nr:PIN-like domain-containing protein [Vibrio sp. 945]
MKELFMGFSVPSNDEQHLVWNKCTFVFDSNVLLSLHRYNKHDRNEILKTIQSISDRVWITYQSALDYQRNVQLVKEYEENKYSRAVKEIKDIKSKISAALSPLRHDFKSNESKKIYEYVASSEAFLDSIIKDINEQRPLFASDVEQTLLSDSINDLFKGKVGNPSPNQEYLSNLYKEADVRYKNKIPPGYLDVSKGGVYTYGNLCYETSYSDFVIWNELIDYAKENKKEYIIFVTDDLKTDWWFVSNGKRIGPRPELVEELRIKANVKGFQIYNSEQLIESINSYHNSPINKSLANKLKLDKAEILINSGDGKLEAAINAGTALEQHLRELCKINGIEIFSNPEKKNYKSAEKLNGELVSKGVYLKNYNKNITSWLGIRNEAAHGNEENYTELQVKNMISEIKEFFDKYRI